MPPTKTIEVRVLPRNLRWEVSVNGVTRRLIDWHAIERAEELMRGERTAQALVIVEGPDRGEEERILVAPGRHSSRAADASLAFDEPGSSETFTHHVAR